MGAEEIFGQKLLGDAQGKYNGKRKNDWAAHNSLIDLEMSLKDCIYSIDPQKRLRFTALDHIHWVRATGGSIGRVLVGRCCCRLNNAACARGGR